MHTVGDVEQPTRPRALAIADAATDGKVAELIADRAARRVPYQGIADELHQHFGVEVSREMVRRWVAVDLAEAAS